MLVVGLSSLPRLGRGAVWRAVLGTAETLLPFLSIFASTRSISISSLFSDNPCSPAPIEPTERLVRSPYVLFFSFVLFFFSSSCSSR